MRATKTWRRHFEGWQVGAVAIFVGSIVTAVIVPRSATPEAIPAPTITAPEIEATRQRNTRAAREAEERELSNDVQLFGARLRVVGRAEYENDKRKLKLGEHALREVTRRALRYPEDLAVLRAYQTRVFIDAYAKYFRTGEMTEDLIELGGGMLKELAHNRWLPPDEPPPAEYDLILAALFRRRWAQYAPSPSHALDRDPVEERALLRYWLNHPPRVDLTSNPAELESASGRFLVQQIDAIGQLDPTYPVLYAKGVVYFKMGHYESSVNAFDAYVRSTPDGPYRLRAVNYLKSALEHANGGG